MAGSTTHDGVTYVSKTSNKRRQRDMDPDFLNYLLTNSSQLDISSLLGDYRKKDEVIPEEKIDSAYRAGVQQDIEDLQSETATIKDTFRRSAVAIGWDDLTDELQLQYRALWTFIDSIKTTTDGNPLVTFDENGYKQIIIQYNNHEYPVVVPTFNTGGVTDELAMAQFRNRIYAAETKIETLEAANQALSQQLQEALAQIQDLYANEGTSIVNTGTTVLNSTIQGMKDDIALLQTSLANKLDGDTVIKDTQISTAFRLRLINLETQMASLTSGTSTASSTTVLPTGYLYVNNDGQTTSRNLVITACVCGTTEEVQMARFRKEDFVIDLTTGQGQKFVESLNTYSASFEVCASPDYDGLLVYDTNLGALAYYISGGECLRIGGGTTTTVVTEGNGTDTVVTSSSKIVVKNRDIATGGYETFTRINNHNKMAPTVLILDYNETTATSGKYINSEGMITVAHTNHSFTLYNDASTQLTVRVIYEE